MRTNRWENRAAGAAIGAGTLLLGLAVTVHAGDFNGDGMLSATRPEPVPGFSNPVTDVAVFAKLFADPDGIYVGTDLPGLVRDRLNELGLTESRIGIVGNFAWSKASIPVEHHEAFKTNLPNATLEYVTEWYEQCRLAKSDEEVQFMQAGAAICDRAFDAFRGMAALTYGRCVHQWCRNTKRSRPFLPANAAATAAGSWEFTAVPRTPVFTSDHRRLCTAVTTSNPAAAKAE